MNERAHVFYDTEIRALAHDMNLCFRNMFNIRTNQMA